METLQVNSKQILQSHLQAVRAGNLDLLMKDYTEESVLITQSGAHKGISEIRAEFEKLLALYPPGSSFDMIQQTIEENYIFLIWAGESDFINIPFASDTFLLSDDKIMMQTFVGQAVPK